MSRAISEMFASISGRYDLANDILSFGTHRLWRTQAVNCLPVDKLPKNARVLDLCCGTGDLAFELQAGLAANQKESAVIVGADFVPQMIGLAEQKKKKLIPIAKSTDVTVQFIVCDALSIPFPENYFDFVTIAFGIRNVDSVENSLSEIRRVLKPGGTALILEFGKPTLPVFSTLYYLYSRFIMPFVGGLATGNMSAYKYLPKTAWQFPAGQEFLKLMEIAGFENCISRPLFGGIAYIYTALGPASSQHSDEFAFRGPTLQSMAG